MPPAAAACAVMAAGKTRQRKPKRAGLPGEAGAAGSPYECRCHGPYTRAYRGACLPSFMVIGSQKAATSKLRWYLSRHPAIDIPKEEAFHGGPNAVLAWDTAADPTKLTAYLDAFEDVCNSSSRISGLKMPVNMCPAGLCPLALPTRASAYTRPAHHACVSYTRPAVPRLFLTRLARSPWHRTIS